VKTLSPDRSHLEFARARITGAALTRGGALAFHETTRAAEMMKSFFLSK
jgi:hypothetical protein